MFTAGELAACQHISKQTLLFYDKIGLFCPEYVDSRNGYRYYSARQLDYLDTILIMKKIGFSLSEIREHMKDYSAENTLCSFRQQLGVLEEKIAELTLLKSRLSHRCDQLEKAASCRADTPKEEAFPGCCILCHPVSAPFGSREISIATKQCYAQAFEGQLPVFFQCGVSVPLELVQKGECTKADTAFLTTDFVGGVANIRKLPRGRTVSLYHRGDYYRMERSYRVLLDYCKENDLVITSPSYEFCINDFVTSRYEEEFLTKILFYVKKA